MRSICEINDDIFFTEPAANKESAFDIVEEELKRADDEFGSQL
jgi:hypothetical protein